MKRRRLGSAGPEISVIGYGAWEAGGIAWGPDSSDDEVLSAMRSAYESGINWMDTAEIYGEGRSEDLVGKAVQGWDQVMVFTKVAPQPRGSGFDPTGIKRAAQGSLRRLRREVIDLFQLHMPDPDISVEASWEAMARLKEAGLVNHIGLSNYSVEMIERCERISHVDALQPHLSMLWRKNQDLLPFCKDNGTGVICYGPLAYGLLTGAITKDTKFGADDWRSGSFGLLAYEQLFASGKLEVNLEIVRRLRPIADRLEMTLSQLAISWILQLEGVTGAIVGSRSAIHVTENAMAADKEIPPKELEEINQILDVPLHWLMRKSS